MGTIQPGYILTWGFSASMPNKDTSLAIEQAIYRSKMMGTIQPGYILEYGKKKTNLATTQTPNIPRYGFIIYYTLYKHRENKRDTIRSMNKQIIVDGVSILRIFIIFSSKGFVSICFSAGELLLTLLGFNPSSPCSSG